MIKKLFCLVTFFCSFSIHASNFEGLKINSNVALLMDLDTRRVLYEKNGYEPSEPASITKIATAYYAIKEARDELQVKITADQDCVGSITKQMQLEMNYRHPPHWLILGGTHMCIARGDCLSLEELLYGMMLISANDAANVVAKYISGSISQFMTDLNDQLQEIGCKNTFFCNPHGMSLPKHRTTAYDMAIIMSEAMKYPLFRQVASSEKYYRPSKGLSKDGLIYNTNELIRSNRNQFYPLATGGKTGILNDNCYSLVSTASKNGRNLVVVLMHCEEKVNVFVDAKALFDAAFREDQICETYLKKGPQPFKQFISSCNKKLHTYLEEDITLSYFPSEKPKVKGEIRWHDPNLPVRKGDVVATLCLKDDQDIVLKEVNLKASHRLASKSKLKRAFIYLFCATVLSVLFYGGRYFWVGVSKR